jgi:U4/U6.U5 tri-snRNP-associated protein 3
MSMQGSGQRRGQPERGRGNTSGKDNRNNNRNDNRNNNRNSNRNDRSPPKHQEDEPEEDLSPEEMMKKMMGFSGFSTTQGKKADANDGTAAEKGYIRKGTSARQYRQYMNRAGGFNRPLDAPKKTL